LLLVDQALRDPRDPPVIFMNPSRQVQSTCGQPEILLHATPKTKNEQLFVSELRVTGEQKSAVPP